MNHSFSLYYKCSAFTFHRIASFMNCTRTYSFTVCFLILSPSCSLKFSLFLSCRTGGGSWVHYSEQATILLQISQSIIVFFSPVVLFFLTKYPYLPSHFCCYVSTQPGKLIIDSWKQQHTLRPHSVSHGKMKSKLSFYLGSREERMISALLCLPTITTGQAIFLSYMHTIVYACNFQVKNMN